MKQQRPGRLRRPVMMRPCPTCRGSRREIVRDSLGKSVVIPCRTCDGKGGVPA